MTPVTFAALAFALLSIAAQTVVLLALARARRERLEAEAERQEAAAAYLEALRELEALIGVELRAGRQHFADLGGVVGRLADELEAGRGQELAGREVIVHTTDGQSLRGIVAVEREDGTLLLEGAFYRQADGSEESLAGRTIVKGPARSWLQMVEG